MNIDSNLNLPVEYYPFPLVQKSAAALRIGDKSLTEAYRLEQAMQRLLNFYPRAAHPLKFEDIVLPYALISEADLPVRLRNEPYQIPSVIQPVHAQIETALRTLYASKGYTAGILTRLQRMDGDRAILQPVSYTDVMATNLIADVPVAVFSEGDFSLGREKSESVNNSISLREIDKAHANTADDLPSLEQSLLANPIGVAGIGISSDQKLLIMHRASHLSTYADVLGGTASGYVDWQDTAGVITLEDVLLNALKREIGEELSLQPDEANEFDFLGLYREFYRAGFVQAFYGFRVQMTAAALAERMSKTPHGEYQAMLAIGVESRPNPGKEGMGINSQIRSLLLADKINQWTIGKELKGLLAALLHSQGYRIKMFLCRD